MTTLVLIGPHGAGKTTLGRALAARLGWTFHDEIGRALAERPDAGHDAADRPEDFDRRVIAHELARDASWDGRPRIVETWHLGNLAYAFERGPRVARELLGTVRRAVRRAGDVLVVPCGARPEVLARRFSEPGDALALLPFFARVARRAERLARTWGLTVTPPVDTSDQGVPTLPPYTRMRA